MFLLAFQEVRLVPDGTMFIHIALILLMIWVLNSTFFRPINRILKARERNKGGQSGEAQEILKQVEEKQARINAALLQARSEGYEIIERERAQAMAQRQTTVTAVKEETERQLETETEAVKQQTVAAKALIEQEAEQLAEKISSNLLKTA